MSFNPGSQSHSPFVWSPPKLFAIAGVPGVVLALGIAWISVPRSQPFVVSKPVVVKPVVVRREHRSGKTHFDLLAKYMADARRGRDEAGLLREISESESDYRVLSQEHALLDAPAPVFTLQDSDGQPWNLSEKLKQGPVILVFYLNYGCDSCVTGLFELSVDYGLFQRLGAQVAAISDDPAELTRQRFKRYGRFLFPVLSDPGHSVARMFSVLRVSDSDVPDKRLHGIFVIHQDGLVKWAQKGDTPFSPFTAVLHELTRLNPTFSSKLDVNDALNGKEDE